MSRDPTLYLEVYFKVDDSVIWDSATTHLPNLLAACERILQRIDQNDLPT